MKDFMQRFKEGFRMTLHGILALVCLIIFGVLSIVIGLLTWNDPREVYRTMDENVGALKFYKDVYTYLKNKYK